MTPTKHHISATS